MLQNKDYVGYLVGVPAEDNERLGMEMTVRFQGLSDVYKKQQPFHSIYN